MILRPLRSRQALSFALTFGLTVMFGAITSEASARSGPLKAILIPKDWQDRFWQTSQAQALLKLAPKELSDLVPKQAGFKFASCPACGENERTDPLGWSIEEPKVVQCRKCEGKFPDAVYPTPNPAFVEKVEVAPGVYHAYPYHPVEMEKAAYPDERIYIQAKCDYETRAFLAKAALYAAVRWNEQNPEERDPALIRIACTLLVRFAQVYPNYAMHTDQPGVGKQLMPAKMPPPYRPGYLIGKWEWNGSLETPLGLVLAYNLLRNETAPWAEVAELLSCRDPKRTIEEDFLLASAELASRQPDDYSEDSLLVYRGMLGVGRLLNDEALIGLATGRLEEFARRSFYYDGFWRGADILSHRRVLSMLDGWIGGLLASPDDVAAVRISSSMFDLARSAAGVVASRPPNRDLIQVSWPVETSFETSSRPILLGGAGLALLSIGGEQPLGIEIRGRDGLSDRRCQRLCFRLNAGGEPLLDDLEEAPPTDNGWELSSPSHNTVVVDGLNQRETPQAARTPTPGGDFLFFTASPDFQVATVSDRYAYPITTSRYRQTFAACRVGENNYAVSIVEVDGGRQHDQIFHSSPRRKDVWRPLVPTIPVSGSLLPPSIAYLPDARPEKGRWFVQAYGAFRPRLKGSVQGPCQVVLGPENPEDPPVLRLHLLGHAPATLITADSPVGPSAEDSTESSPPRSSLIIRRRSEVDEPISSVFVTLFEPIHPDVPPLGRVGRVETGDDVVVILIETSEGPEHLIFNRKPGTAVRAQLANGRHITTDGLAVRVRGDDVTLAGGTYVEAAGKLVSQKSIRGTITAVEREVDEQGRGWFITPEEIPEGFELAGRTLFVEHGDGSVRSWTLDSVESSPRGTRLRVREEPGFQIDSRTGSAEYYQFPLSSNPGPHKFRVAMATRDQTVGSRTSVRSRSQDSRLNAEPTTP